MKKVISIILLAVLFMSISCAGAFAASDSYKATWTVKASVMNAASTQQADRTNYLNAQNKTVYSGADGKTVCVYPGQVVWATVHLKTGSSYYAGDLAANIYYTSSIFTSTSQSGNSYIWNTSGKYTSICTRLGAPFSKLTDYYKSLNYPPEWSDQKKNAHGMYSLVMAPDVNISKTTYANVDEDLVTVPIYVKSNAPVGAEGCIFMTNEDQRTPSNTDGRFMLTYYKNGDLLSEPVISSDKIVFDMSASTLNFIVCSKNAKGVDIAEDSLDMNYKSTKQLTASVTGEPSAKPVWSSSDPSVASVDSDGNVTATGRGSTVITASYGEFSDSCEVTVSYSFVQWLIVILLFGWIWY